MLRQILLASSAAAATITMAAPLAAQTTAIDTASAMAAIQEFRVACASADRLWALPLCGPIALVDGPTRTAFLSHAPKTGAFSAHSGAWVGRWPDALAISNTSVVWDGDAWAVVRIPLPRSPAGRAALLNHERFHAIQRDIGITETDALNAHLDERHGRTWLRLELAALAHALTSHDTSALRHTRNALWMRMKRHSLYPGADTLERMLEMAEGVAEYTGRYAASKATGLGPLDVVDRMRGVLTDRSLVRSFAYATGPALGLLLDRFDTTWRGRLITTRNPWTMLRDVVKPGALPGDEHLRSIAEAYGFAQIDNEEMTREAERQRTLAQFIEKLVDGPVIEVPGIVNRAFDPTTLTPLGSHGTVYPLGAFSGDWGRVSIQTGIGLLAPDNTMLRLERPDVTDGLRIEGRGWVLQLNEGWMLGPGTRPGDLRVTRKNDDRSENDC